MRHTALIMMLLALVVGGCGGRTYYKNPSASPAQEQKDYSECDFEAAKATGNLPSKAEREDRLKELVDKCMKARGYTN
ncbi:MAG: hypothetical protein AB7U59_15980 [Desulfovibrionaceae bacterium]